MVWPLRLELWLVPSVQLLPLLRMALFHLLLLPLRRCPSLPRLLRLLHPPRLWPLVRSLLVVLPQVLLMWARAWLSCLRHLLRHPQALAR